MCEHRLVNGEVDCCVLRNAMCYKQKVECAVLCGKLAVKRVHEQRLVNRGPSMKQALALKPFCGSVWLPKRSNPEDQARFDDLKHVHALHLVASDEVGAEALKPLRV